MHNMAPEAAMFENIAKLGHIPDPPSTRVLPVRLRTLDLPTEDLPVPKTETAAESRRRSFKKHRPKRVLSSQRDSDSDSHETAFLQRTVTPLPSTIPDASLNTITPVKLRLNPILELDVTADLNSVSQTLSKKSDVERKRNKHRQRRKAHEKEDDSHSEKQDSEKSNRKNNNVGSRQLKTAETSPADRMIGETSPRSQYVSTRLGRSMRASPRHYSLQRTPSYSLQRTPSTAWEDDPSEGITENNKMDNGTPDMGSSLNKSQHLLLQQQTQRQVKSFEDELRQRACELINEAYSERHEEQPDQPVGESQNEAANENATEKARRKLTERSKPSLIKLWSGLSLDASLQSTMSVPSARPTLHKDGVRRRASEADMKAVVREELKSLQDQR